MAHGCRFSDLEKVFEYLRRSLSIAWKSVFFNFKQYSCFFIAIMIVQVLYGMMTISADNNNHVEYQHVTEQYDYHMVLKNLNEDQATYLINDEGTVFKSDKIFDVVRYDGYNQFLADTPRFDVYLLFVGKNIDYSVERFEKKYETTLKALAEEGVEYTKVTTPLLTFEDNIAVNTVTFIVITAILLALSIFLLTSLYNIRINHYKFQYGIYLTFGADFKMLFGTAFWELFIIFIVTFIPSALISTLISLLVYSASGYGFVFSALSFLKIFGFTLAVILASVWTPMKVMSVKDPMSLIITEDNSNLVTSPRRSFNIFMEKFPTKYEFCSIWRFRKYNLQLLTTAIVFCAMFIMGLYMADIYTTDLHYPRAQFTIDLESSRFEYDNIMSDELYAMDGVRAVALNDNAIEARHIASHMLVHKSNTKLFSGLVNYTGSEFSHGGDEKEYRASNDVLYTAMSEEQLRILEDYTYTGNLKSLLQPGYVIVGDAISNITSYKFNVGDKIYLSKHTGQIKVLDSNLTGKNLLKNQIKYFRFDYLEFTVGAVIHDIPSGSTPIYLNHEDYTSLTGRNPSAASLSIFVNEDITDEEANNLYSKISSWAHTYGDVKITNNETTFKVHIDEDKHYNELYICISMLILCISPLVWFFSQTLYYSKREREFNILQSIGAVSREIKQIYLQGGLSMAAMSLIISVVLSYLGSYALFFVYNVVMPYFTHENVRYVFYMPWYAITASVVISVFCGFFSSYIPFRAYYKNRYSLQNGGAGAEFGGEE